MESKPSAVTNTLDVVAYTAPAQAPRRRQVRCERSSPLVHKLRASESEASMRSKVLIACTAAAQVLGHRRVRCARASPLIH